MSATTIAGEDRVEDWDVPNLCVISECPQCGERCFNFMTDVVQRLQQYERERGQRAFTEIAYYCRSCGKRSTDAKYIIAAVDKHLNALRTKW